MANDTDKKKEEEFDVMEDSVVDKQEDSTEQDGTESADEPKDIKAEWTAKQTYLAVGNLLSAAASLKIDTCPMEGFEPKAYNEALGLTEKGLNAAVVVALGYRSEEDETQHYKKVRQSKEKLFTHI